MNTEEQRRQFEQAVMPHFDAAYNLARWLTRNEHDAEDVTHEAFVRAMRFFGGFRGGDAKPWLLAIVRNTYLNHFEREKHRRTVPFDEALHDTPETAPAHGSATETNPELLLVRKASAQLVNRALRSLPPEAREVLILRELEELSYKDIAAIVHVPIGTVMSRLHRGRRLLREALERLDEELQR